MNTFAKAALAVSMLAALVPVFASQKDTPQQADALIAKAQAQAKKENKAVFVVFDASW